MRRERRVSEFLLYVGLAAGWLLFLGFRKLHRWWTAPSTWTENDSLAYVGLSPREEPEPPAADRFCPGCADRLASSEGPRKTAGHPSLDGILGSP